jgi:hypothetical protein
MLGKTVQSMKKQAPMYTITGRSKRGGFDEDLQQTPGPGNQLFVLKSSLLQNKIFICCLGAYNVTKAGLYKLEPPHYSMTARNEMPGDSTQKPGPGKYSPEKVWVHKQQAPGYSFGIRHSMYEAPLIVEVKE